MNSLLGFLIFSFTVNAALIVPFIDLLYHLKFQRPHAKTADFLGQVNSIFNKLHRKKGGVPVGGGLLIIITTSLLFLLVTSMLKVVGADIGSVYNYNQEVYILFSTFIFFGLLGLYDDVMKFFNTTPHKVGISWKAKLVGQLTLGTAVGYYLYSVMGISILNIPYLGVWDMGVFFIPFAALFITTLSNAVNITDGLDGLAPGLLMITLFALTLIAASILDTPISLFIALWVGALLAFLYFNTYPARIHLGDVGALSFGATLAVIALLLGKVIAVTMISSIFLLELATSSIQMFGKKYLGRKLLPISPFHLWLQTIGWEEPKIVARGWLAGIIMAIVGLWIAFI